MFLEQGGTNGPPYGHQWIVAYAFRLSVSLIVKLGFSGFLFKKSEFTFKTSVVTQVLVGGVFVFITRLLYA